MIIYFITTTIIIKNNNSNNYYIIFIVILSSGRRKRVHTYCNVLILYIISIPYIIVIIIIIIMIGPRRPTGIYANPRPYPFWFRNSRRRRRLAYAGWFRFFFLPFFFFTIFFRIFFFGRCGFLQGRRRADVFLLWLFVLRRGACTSKIRSRVDTDCRTHLNRTLRERRKTLEFLRRPFRCYYSNAVYFEYYLREEKIDSRVTLKLAIIECDRLSNSNKTSISPK